MRSWWDMNLCRGKTKAGKSCNKFCRRPFEICSGNLYIPITCNIHADQEEQLIKEYNNKTFK